MPTVLVNTTDIVSTAPNYQAVGKWCETYSVGLPVYKKEFWDEPGEDGQGVKRHGFRYRRITLHWKYVAEDAAVAIETDWVDLCDQGNTISIDGRVYPNCEIETDQCKYTLPEAVVATSPALQYCELFISLIQRSF